MRIYLVKLIRDIDYPGLKAKAGDILAPDKDFSKYWNQDYTYFFYLETIKNNPDFFQVKFAEEPPEITITQKDYEQFLRFKEFENTLLTILKNKS